MGKCQKAQTYLYFDVTDKKLKVKTFQLFFN